VNLAGASGARGLIPLALAAARDGTSLDVNGEGRAVRDYLHVADAARAVRLALEAAVPGEHRLFNVSTGRGSSVLEVIRAAELVTGRRIEVVHRPPTPEPERLVADPARIRAELHWRAGRSDLVRVVRDSL
jgi:UDP-glucose 4-epimerase